jgi:glycerol-3-phosphate acyltransferase PlsY
VIVLGLVIVAYLLGSTPTSLLLARTRGIDLRKWGSGNLGATNLYRATGFPLAALCTLVDVAKGFIPARFFPRIDGVDLPQLALAYGVAAVLGHIVSVWVKFRGGKGVATGAGVYLALAPPAVGLSFVVWALAILTVRIASVASLSAATLFPLWILLTGHRLDFVFWASLPLVALVWWTHRSNLRRLLAGREPRVSRGQGAPAAEQTADFERGETAGG